MSPEGNFRAPSSSVFVSDKFTRNIAFSLISISTAAWLVSYYFLMPMFMGGSTIMMGAAGVVHSFNLSSISFFEIVWIVGTVAMMFPAMIPVVLFYNKIVAKQESTSSVERVIGTPLFLGGYLTMYLVLGIVSYSGIYETMYFATYLPGLVSLSTITSSGILIATGIYQFTSLKSRCLSNCASPLGFFTFHYSSGNLGSLKMGMRHGVYCVGCCWAFMLVMLGVGAMSIPVMAFLAAIIALEKILVRGAVWFSRLVGVAFLTLGVLALVYPSVLTMIS